MMTEPSDAERIRRFPWLIIHQATNNIFCTLTMFGSVFVLFLDQVGLPKARIGFLLSLIPFSTLLSLAVAPAIARAGQKRVFLLFWGVRKGVVALLLLTPWVLAAWGPRAGFLFVAAIVLAFALCRAMGETAYYPWSQTMLPTAMRGRLIAVLSTTNTLAACAALAAASYVIGHGSGLPRFMWLIGIGVAFGAASVFFGTLIPGGAPVQDEVSQAAHFGGMRRAVADRRYAWFLAGAGAVNLACATLSFLPLFLKEQIGLPASRIILLDIAGMAAGVLSGYLLGYVADRRGGWPVLFAGTAAYVLLPVCYYLLPRGTEPAYVLVVVIAFFGGLAGTAYGIGLDRHLYTALVPPAQRVEYLTVYYAWSGLVSGGGPLAAGWLLERSKGLSGAWCGLRMDPYLPVLAAGAACFVLGLAFMGRCRFPRAGAVASPR